MQIDNFTHKYANAHTYKKYCYYNQVVTFRYLSNLVVEVLCTALFLFLQRRLASAAKKAIAKIPQRTLKAGDKVGRYVQLLSTIRLTLSHHRGTHKQPHCQTNYCSVVAVDGHGGPLCQPYPWQINCNWLCIKQNKTGKKQHQMTSPHTH